MPEAKTPRHVRLSDEVEAQQLIDRLECRRPVESGSGCGQLGVEGIAGDRRAAQQAARGVGEERKLVCQCRGDARRYVEIGQRVVSCLMFQQLLELMPVTLVLHGRGVADAAGEHADCINLRTNRPGTGSAVI